MVGTMIQGLIVLNVPSYTWHNYHGTLLTIAVIFFSTTFNTLLAARLPFIEGMVLILHLLGFFVIAVPLWVMAQKADPRVLVEFSNNGGWESKGLSALIGLSSPMGVLIGYDCSVHMCKDPFFLLPPLSLLVPVPSDPTNSGRDPRCLSNAPPLHHLVRNSQRPPRFHHGHHVDLHSW